jgi:phage major head subunit gpT-like protein
MAVQGLKALSSRSVIGYFFEEKTRAALAAWVALVSWLNESSNQETETYAGLGANPAMAETKGQLNISRFSTKTYDIRNVAYDASIEIPVAWMRRDKTGQVRQRMAALANAGVVHWRSLLSTLLINGETGACYDGANFFSATHAEGKSGTQLNLLTKTQVAALQTVSATVPTAAEMAKAILGVIRYMQCYKDDKGEYCQEDASQFLVMCPPNSIYEAALNAVTAEIIGSTTNVVPKSEVKISVVQNARLSAWTSSFAVFVTDSPVKALIRQEEVKEELKVIAEGSERETEHGTHLYSCQATRAAGYGDWRKCAKCTIST